MIIRKSEETLFKEAFASSREKEKTKVAFDYRQLADAFHPFTIDEKAIKRWKGTISCVESTRKHNKTCGCSYCQPSADTIHPHNTAYPSRYDRLAPDGVLSNSDEFVSPSRTLEEQKAFFNEVWSQDHSRELPSEPIDKDLPDVMLKRWFRLLEAEPAIAGIHEEEKPIEVAEDKPKSKLKGMLVFYIEVGQLAPDKAERLVERTKEEMASTLSRVPDDWGVVFTPIRTGNARTEVINFV